VAAAVALVVGEEVGRRRRMRVLLQRLLRPLPRRHLLSHGLAR
jgi:hypothetical protein